MITQFPLILHDTRKGCTRNYRFLDFLIFRRNLPNISANSLMRVALQLLAEHPLTRVEQAIQACRGDGVVTAERIAGCCERLALRITRGELMNPSGQLRLIPHSGHA